jgi:glycosyltransferase involved in cell wall biosynthesis
MHLISIIVPVYNVEKYLRRCIDSILAQTFTDYECILIDDGSPDNCPAICDEYVVKDDRIVVVHQQNKGTAFARDAGIKTANAEFLVFVDSDDWLEPDALAQLYKKQQETDADIVMGGYRNWFSYMTTEYVYPEIYQTNDVLLYFFFNSCNGMWGKLYQKSLFDECVVSDISTGEDAIINIQIFNKIKIEKLKKIDSIVYNYDHRTNGITIRIYQQPLYSIINGGTAFKAKMWIEKYLNTLHIDPNILQGFYYFVIRRDIIPSLRFFSKIPKDEIVFLYQKYYKHCVYKNKIPFPYRLLFNLFYYCYPLAQCYKYLLNATVLIVQFLMKRK